MHHFIFPTQNTWISSGSSIINGESFNQFKKENKVEVNKESIIIGSGNYNIEYVKF